MKRPHFLSNANTALQFLQSKKVSTPIPHGRDDFSVPLRAAAMDLSLINAASLFSQIKLVNINSSDLVDGRPPVVLGLIWTIILYFQVIVVTLSAHYEFRNS